ncbi:MAG TPA: hypothetical protein VJ779_09625 [Acetobacteraceae bacterium]|nr:hypothetical protein [Acetobacteraceae bacterium]
MPAHAPFPSISELYRRMAAGQIAARKSGRTTLVLMASLRAHLEGLPPATFRPRSRAA